MSIVTTITTTTYHHYHISFPLARLYSSNLHRQHPSIGSLQSSNGIGKRLYRHGSLNFLLLFSSVPTVKDVQVPETLLKKQKADAKATEQAAAKKAELKKASRVEEGLGAMEKDCVAMVMISGVKPID